MVICFDATSEAKKALDSILAAGGFRDTSEAISTALISYDALCRAHKSGGEASLNAIVNRQPDYNAAQLDIRQPTHTKPAGVQIRIPELFALKRSNSQVTGFQSAPRENSAPRTIDPSKWFFGQFNKFLPVKTACRALLNLLGDQPKGIPLEDAKVTIADAAWQLGDVLFVIDERQLRGREDAFTAAFPVTAANGPQSRLRFGNQFVGSFGQGKLSGFPASLRFIHLTSAKDLRISLTKAGAEFAVLESPILDGDAERAAHKLSPDELKFLVDHIQLSVPEELSAYCSIVEGIAEGANTPEKLDDFLCRRFKLQIAAKPETPHELTKTFLTTQRTGVISRMVDLQLIAREKKGLHVTYKITPSGQHFQNQIQ